MLLRSLGRLSVWLCIVLVIVFWRVVVLPSGSFSVTVALAVPASV